MTPLREWHARFPGGSRWRLTPFGVEVEGLGHPRTPGKPATMAGFVSRFRDHLFAASEQFGMPVELILATMGAEGGRLMVPVRHEPGYAVHLVPGLPDGATVNYLNRFWRDIPVESFAEADEATPHRVSIGVMHTLISTARDSVGRNVDRRWLLDVGNSILAGSAYIAKQKVITFWDPPVVGAAYNSGGVYQNNGIKNRWRMRMYPIGTGAHVDRWVAWYNDAVEVMRGGAAQMFSVTHSRYY